jgi:uncharacterized protein YndB with AHSA1/START domain
MMYGRPLPNRSGSPVGWRPPPDWGRLNSASASPSAEVEGGPFPDWSSIFDDILPAYQRAFPHASARPTGHLVGTTEKPVIVIEREFSASAADVWSAWTEPDRLARWLGAVDGSMARAGAVVRIAMSQTELPADPAAADNPATFTVHEAQPPTAENEGRLTFTFEDAADPGGVVTVLVQPVSADHCRLRLQHALAPVATALEYSSTFGAGWEGFLDWLEDALDGRQLGPDGYEPLVPYYERERNRLVRASGATSADHAGTVRE